MFLNNYLLTALGILTLLLGGIESAAAGSSTHTDAEGDALDTFGAGGPLLDIDTITAEIVGDDLRFTIAFHGPISAPSTALPNSIFGGLEIDLDDDLLTGFPPIQNQFDPPFNALDIGVDLIVDFIQEMDTPGEFAVLSTSSPVFELIPATFGLDEVTFDIPLSTLGGDTTFSYAMILGSPAQPTDAIDTVGVVDLAAGPTFLRSDCNDSGVVNLADAIFTLTAIMGSGAMSCEDACDADDSGSVDMADAIHTLNVLFGADSAPLSPCASDSTTDTLSCDAPTSAC